MIRHILLMSFNDGTSQEQITLLRDAFLYIPRRIEGVVSVEWGENDSPESKNAGYTHCVLMTFKDDNARQCYLPHPEHEALKLILRPLLRNIIVLDYAL